MILTRPTILAAAIAAFVLACLEWRRGRGNEGLAWLTASAWAFDSWQQRGAK